MPSVKSVGAQPGGSGQDKARAAKASHFAPEAEGGRGITKATTRVRLEEGDDNCVKVCVRVRPLSKAEASTDPREVVLCNSQCTQGLRLTSPSTSQSGHSVDYTFDAVLSGGAQQHLVYQCIGDRLVQGVANGFHGCAFAYGQTSCGKSFTIFGGKGEDRGLVSRLAESLFQVLNQQTEEHMVRLSYLELYNEKARDLLQPSQDSSNSLDVCEHPQVGVFVQGLSRNVVSNTQDVYNLLDFGHKIRVVGCTNMNAMSSRSHAIVTLHVESVVRSADGSANPRQRRRAQVHAVDLAGSERLSHAGSNELRQKESRQINKSLLALRQMISRLVEKEQAVRKGAPGAPHIPYRSSKLTFLLSEALMGNCRTTMLACVSPSASCFPMTESTIRFAASVKKLHTRPVKNEEAEGDLVRTLHAEIENLRAQLSDAQAPRRDIQEKLTSDLYLESELTTSWDESQARSRNADSERRRTLLRLGLQEPSSQPKTAHGMRLPPDDGAPYLVNVCSDALLSGCLSYAVPPGQTVWIGSNASCGVKVTGLGVQPFMCSLVCADVATVEVRVPESTLKAPAPSMPEEQDVDERPRRRTSRRGTTSQFGPLFKRSVVEVLVNGREVLHRRQLKDGDVLRVGSTHSFRVCIPRGKPGGDEGQQLQSTLSKEHVRQLVDSIGPQRTGRLLWQVSELEPLIDEANDITDELRGGEAFELLFKLYVLNDMADDDEDPSVTVVLRRMERPDDVTKAGPQFNSAAVSGSVPVALWSVQQFQQRLDVLRDLYQEVSAREVAWGEPQDLDPWRVEEQIPFVGQRRQAIAASPAAEVSAEPDFAFEDAQREELALLQKRVPQLAAELLQVRGELAKRDVRVKELGVLQKRLEEMKEMLDKLLLPPVPAPPRAGATEDQLSLSAPAQLSPRAWQPVPVVSAVPQPTFGASAQLWPPDAQAEVTCTPAPQIVHCVAPQVRPQASWPQPSSVQVLVPGRSIQVPVPVVGPCLPQAQLQSQPWIGAQTPRTPTAGASCFASAAVRSASHGHVPATARAVSPEGGFVRSRPDSRGASRRVVLSGGEADRWQMVQGKVVRLMRELDALREMCNERRQ